ISGNGAQGIYVFGPGSSSTANVLQGNYVGTDVTGTQALGNTIGVTIDSSSDNTVGGTQAGAGHLLSGNTVLGMDVFGSAARNLLQGNLIGTDVTGTIALGNRVGGLTLDLGSNNNTVGGTASGSRNVISGNGNAGILISAFRTSNNVVQGNYVGTDVSGTQALGNQTGVVIRQGAGDNVIGGTAAGAGNLVSGNLGDGIQILGGGDFGTTGNVVQGNYVGTDVSGTLALANQRGITITG